MRPLINQHAPGPLFIPAPIAPSLRPARVRIRAPQPPPFCSAASLPPQTAVVRNVRRRPPFRLGRSPQGSEHITRKLSAWRSSLGHVMPAIPTRLLPYSHPKLGCSHPSRHSRCVTGAAGHWDTLGFPQMLQDFRQMYMSNVSTF